MMDPETDAERTDWWTNERKEEDVFLPRFSPHSSCLFLCLVTYRKAPHLERNPRLFLTAAAKLHRRR